MSPFKTKPVIFAPGDTLEAEYRRDLFIEREEYIEKFATQLEPALHGRSPNNIFVDGKCGSGKTCTTKYILESLAREMNKVGKTLSTAHISVSQDSTAYQTLINITNSLRELRGKDCIPKTGHPYEQVKDKLVTELNNLHGVLYIVIDEADSIRNPDKLFEDLSRLTERNNLSELKIGIIGIANNMSFLENFSSATYSTLQPRQLTFEGYNSQEIKEILRKRADEAFLEGVLQPDVVPLCASLCAGMGGDVRDGLELLNLAGEMVRVRVRNSDSAPRTITTDDLYKAEEEIVPTWLEQTVQSLSESKQEVLYSVLKLEVSNNTSVKTVDIHRHYSAQFGNGGKSERQVRSYLRSFRNRGLLNKGHTNNGRDSRDPGSFDTFSLAPELSNIVIALGTGDFPYIDLLTKLCEDAVRANRLSKPERDSVISRITN